MGLLCYLNFLPNILSFNVCFSFTSRSNHQGNRYLTIYQSCMWSLHLFKQKRCMNLVFIHLWSHPCKKSPVHINELTVIPQFAFSFHNAIQIDTVNCIYQQHSKYFASSFMKQLEPHICCLATAESPGLGLFGKK